MANLRELFSDLFAYVLLCEHTIQHGESQPAYAQVQGEITALLRRAEDTAKRQGMLDQEYQEAQFAVVAWVDETILNNTMWKDHNQWKASPLQVEYYQTRNAGEEFFDHLDRLRPDQKEIRELYYLCLSLGFKGQYFLGREDELRLIQIRHEQAPHLPLTVEEIRDLDKITPQPYNVSAPKGTPIRLPLTHLLLRVGLVMLVILPLALFLYYWLQQTPAPRDGVVKIPFVPPGPKEEEMQKEMQQRITNLQCAKVSFESIDMQAGILTLSGRVASETQKAEILAAMQSIKGVSQVRETFELIPPPFCAVLDLLEPVKKRAEEQGFGVTAGLNKTGNPPIYYKEENLIIEFKTPTPFASYVYVDYYTADGGVGHLFPNLKEPQHFFQPQSSFTIGKPGGPLQWQILPPFGRELVTVIASKTSLFAIPRFDPEPAETYLNELRQAVEKRAPSDMAAIWYFLKTQDR
jgi:type IV/VI secretion system ImpK/VasF family protein